MPRKGQQLGTCHTCQHPERARIELLCAGGAGHKALARKYGISRDSIGRHWEQHVAEERKAALAVGPVERAALAARVAEESESVLDHYRTVRAGLYALYDAAVTAGDRQSGAQLAGRLTTLLDSIARVTGQLHSSPLVQINNNTVFLNDPQFARFQARLIRALSAFPEARAAVIAEFERLEQPPAPSHAALEHTPL